MKLLIGGSSSKFFHLKEFSESLKKLGINCKLVHDVEYSNGFPSRKISHWIQGNSKFNRLIHEFKPDAILVDRQRHFGIASLKSNIPLLVLLRGDPWEELTMAKKTLYKSPPKRVALRAWEKMATECIERAKIIFPICNHLEKVVKGRYPNKTTAVLYSGITSSRWFPVKGMKLKHPCVGLLQGAVIWEKTKEMLSLTKVMESMPDVTFYWAGDGPYRNEVLPKLRKYSNFHWLGPLNYPNKVREFLTEIDVYALITGIDMSPLTLQEAQLMEKPVIVTNVGGVSELMKDNETGFLVEKGNHKDLLDKLSILLDNPVKTKQMGVLGKKFVENNFNWNKIALDFKEIVERYLINL